MKKYCLNTILNLEVDEKLDIIEEIEDKENISVDDLKIIDALSYDLDEEVRARVAEAITDTNIGSARDILVRLINDRDYLVRVNVCEALRNDKSPNTVELLKTRVLKDRYSLVRGYATLSLADIVVENNYEKNEFINFFLNALSKEKIIWVKICIYKALYLMECTEFLNLILKELNNKAYRNRCLVVNILAEIISEYNSDIIIKALIDRKSKEKAIAVSSSIDNLLNRNLK